MPDMTRRDLHRTALGGLAFTVAGGALSHARPAAASSRPFRYLHYDVFTDRPLAGNQLAVFVEPSGLDTDAMAAMTREMNYSESTFVFPKEDEATDVRVRIFGRNGEMPFAGHPTIGTTFALAHTGAITVGRPRVVLGLGVGPTPVDLEWREGRLAFAWMSQLLPTYGKTIEDVPALAAALGVEAAALTATGRRPEEIGCGSTFLLVPLASRSAVDAVSVDGRAMEAVFAKAGMTRRGVLVFSTETAADGATAYSRMVGANGFEDPATGSAAGPLGCYLVRHGLVEAEKASRIVSRQGVKMRRPSTLHVDIRQEGSTINAVRVGGTSVLVGEGTLLAG